MKARSSSRRCRRWPKKASCRCFDPPAGRLRWSASSAVATRRPAGAAGRRIRAQGGGTRPNSNSRWIAAEDRKSVRSIRGDLSFRDRRGSSTATSSSCARNAFNLDYAAGEPRYRVHRREGHPRSQPGQCEKQVGSVRPHPSHSHERGDRLLIHPLRAEAAAGGRGRSIVPPRSEFDLAIHDPEIEAMDEPAIAALTVNSPCAGRVHSP